MLKGVGAEGNKWTREQADANALGALLAEIRAAAIGCQDLSLPTITVRDVRRAFSLLRWKTGRGTDSWYPLRFAALPDAALADLADIYNECEELMVLPVQALVNFIALIPKLAGGYRPIALTTLIYAL